MNGVRTLADMVARRDEFLANHGNDPDLDDISLQLGIEDEPSDDVLLGLWFDRIVADFEMTDAMEVYRHMTVPDVDAFADAVADGNADLGCHWSSDTATWSPYCMSGDDIVLSGRIDREQVDWFTTFQQRFGHPSEAETVFEGEVRLDSLRCVSSGRAWPFCGRLVRTGDGEIPAAFAL